MDSVKCCVCTCSYENSKHLLFYPPPDLNANEDWHAKWMTAIGQTKTIFSHGSAELKSFPIQAQNKLVCARHFEADCFIEEARLKTNALPTKFMQSEDEGHVQLECELSGPELDLGQVMIFGQKGVVMQEVLVQASSSSFITNNATDAMHNISYPYESPTLSSTDLNTSFHGELENVLKMGSSETGEGSGLLQGDEEGDWSLIFSPAEEIQSDKFIAQETDPSTPITQPVIVEEIENPNGELSVSTRTRKPKKKKAIGKKRKPARGRKVTPAEEAEMDTSPPVDEPLLTTKAKIVSVSTRQPMALKKRKHESPPEATRSLRLKIRKDLMPHQQGNEPTIEITQKLVVPLTDCLEQLNIKWKNISKDSRFRVDPSGNIQLITANSIGPKSNETIPVPSTSQAQTHQLAVLKHKLAQMTEENVGLRKQNSLHMELINRFKASNSPDVQALLTPQQDGPQDTPVASRAPRTQKRKSKKAPSIAPKGDEFHITEDELDQLAANSNPAIFIRKVMRKVFSYNYLSSVSCEQMDEIHQMVIIEATLKRYRCFLRADRDLQKISPAYVCRVMESEFSIHQRA